jgi:hypothetical protein
MFGQAVLFFFRDCAVSTRCCVSGLRWDTSVFARIGGVRNSSLQALSPPVPAKISAPNSVGLGRGRTGASPVPTVLRMVSRHHGKPYTLCLPEWVAYTRMGNPRERRGVPAYPLRRGRYDRCTLPHCQATRTFDGSSSLKNMSCLRCSCGFSSLLHASFARTGTTLSA